MVVIPGSGIMVEESKTPKEEAGYRHHEKCGTCGHYNSNRQCDVVEGNIAPDSVCNLYTLIADKVPYNKEYFEKAYEEE